MTFETYERPDSNTTLPFTPERALTHIPERYINNPKTFAEQSGIINVGSNESDPRSRLLSNFARTPFVLDGVRYASVEAFIQALKVPDADEQERISTLVGVEAKKVGRDYRAEISGSYELGGEGVEPEGYVTNYQGIQIPYRSPEHYALIERAIRAKFDQNSGALDALVGDRYSERARITHVLARSDGSIVEESPTTALPAEVFTSILMNIRHEKQMEYWRHQVERYGEGTEYQVGGF